jgi:site-specific recombinase XerD
MNRAGLEGIKAAPKGLRHAFAVSCVEEMIPLTDIQDLLGHAKIETTKVYLTLVGKERHTMVSRTWPKGQK